MSTPQFPDQSTHIVNGVYEVASHHVGKSLVDILRCYFTGGKIRRGDYYLGRSRSMMAQHYAGLRLVDRIAVEHGFANTIDAKGKLQSANGSMFKKYSLAKDYKQIAKELFVVVESASNRAADRYLMDQISRAMAERATQPPPMETTSTFSNPFSGSHEVSPLTDVDVGNLNQVEMSIFESEARGETAVVLELHGRDATTQEAVATFPLEVRAGDRAGEEADRATVSSYDTAGHSLHGPHSESGDGADR